MAKQKKTLIVGSIALHPNEWLHLDKLATKAARSRNNYIRQVLLQHLGQKTI